MRRGPFILFLLDLYALGKQLLCVIRRKHRSVRQIGELGKKGGYRGIPVTQCTFCGTIQTVGTPAAEKRFGGKAL